MRSLFVLLTIAVAIGLIVNSLIENADTKALAVAQAEAARRVVAAVDAFAGKAGLSQDWVAYCRVETQRKIGLYPKDGSIPFGLRYSSATAAEVQAAMRVREQYEMSDQILCLATLRNALRGADDPVR
ncbi:hypothetical protein OPKNFCMD_2146 [Methylobacterium crusticola]|uniref:DUF3365 domain-containing protein n=1 Tax=Methylobacterium crusticola TaxID=1697972 RepID=A0ABQ4QXQ2_9HYPH|nr:hypothetical protein [Methylobacterium crusticola]GJD49416.1 hypothetical protein OPKNFCMD_2146 [Methylobacterium crusticola]